MKKIITQEQISDIMLCLKVTALPTKDFFAINDLFAQLPILSETPATDKPEAPKSN